MSNGRAGVGDEVRSVGQADVWTLPAAAAETLGRDGFFIAPPPMSPGDLDAIRRELDQWTHTPALNGYGCIFSAGDALLQNLALFSPAAFKAALSEDMLDFMERAFGQPAILAKIEYRRAVEAKTEMPMHCDPGHDISVYIYLDGVDRDRGFDVFDTRHPGHRNRDERRLCSGSGFGARESRPRTGLRRRAAGGLLVFSHEYLAWPYRNRSCRPGNPVALLCAGGVGERGT